MKTPNPDDTIPTRRSLLERLKNWDDQTSWQDFFNTYWRLIYSIARQAGLTEAEAQDVVQETVLCVARKMGEFKTERSFGSFKSWLLQITRRRISDQFRRRPRWVDWGRQGSEDTGRTPFLERVAGPDCSALEAVWQREWEQNLVEAALERVKQLVSSKQYLLYYQQAVKQWPAQKLAAKYGLSIAQVYMAKYRVSRVFKRELKKLKTRLL